MKPVDQRETVIAGGETVPLMKCRPRSSRSGDGVAPALPLPLGTANDFADQRRYS